MLFSLFYHKTEPASALKTISNQSFYHLKNLVTTIFIAHALVLNEFYQKICYNGFNKFLIRKGVYDA